VWIGQLDLTQWRNHEQSRLQCTPGITVLVGPNGEGKTNIVEAIRYLATLGSHRVGSLGPLIRDGSESATVFATLHHGDRDITMGLTLRRNGASDATLHGSKAKVSEIPKWVSTVLFSPEDTAIIRGEPSYRRNFMDELVVGGSPSMVGVFQDFDRLLKQRNSLLKSLRGKSSQTELSTLDTWTEQFVHTAAHIVEQRRTCITEITPGVAQEYHNLAVGDSVTAEYVAKGYDLPDETDAGDVAVKLATALGELRSEELDRGMTLAGPHRDDLELCINNKPARSHASQGETWSLALALRLGMASWLRTRRASGDPIIILDDVFAELDAQRRERLVGTITGYEQLLVTAAVEEDLPPGLAGTRFDVRGGMVSPR